MLVYIAAALLSLSFVALLAAVQVMHGRGHAYQAFCWFRVGIFSWLFIACVCYAAFKDVVAGMIAAGAFAVIGILFLPNALKSSKHG